VSESQSAPKFNNYAEADVEYRAALACLAIETPSSFLPPVHLRCDPNTRIQYEREFGAVAAHLLAVESIEHAIVDLHRAGDHAGADYWLNVAGTWPDTDVFRRFNDHTVQASWMNTFILPALEGDFANISAMVDARRRHLAPTAVAAISD
jgi:hypothetical protein